MEIFLGFVLLSFNGYHSVIGTDDFYHDTFPNDFLWGVATSSYQIEGAWNEGGKSEHIWDRFSHDNNNWHNDTGDIACDSYHKYMEDIQLIRSLGASSTFVDFYRFSIAWTRIIPDPIAYRTGRNKSLNQPGVNYYNNVINELLKYNIKPLVTLYHWDLPQSLQEKIGGWNGSDIVDYYNDYADAAFKTFGDRVKHWITFNEPWVICWMGHGSAEYAPGIKEPSVTPYRCGHHIIKSHAKAYDTYKHRYKTTQKGIVGITMNSDTMHPKNESNQEHIDAAERGQQFMLGWFAHPIYKDGDYPKVMKDNIGDRLPKFTPQEIALNKGVSSFNCA
ncbi:LCT [Mytilus edulis]|uniref:LCT n=1 Tax=Mytilus edulis TaxID=6550 RepID=A0A8S3RES5_MYTED|nr:LCT [Mytilus edulis]